MMMNMGPPPPPPLYGAAFEVIVGPSKPIVGVVREKGTGRPAAGIVVRGIEPTSWTWIYARTDKDGRFRLLGLPKAGVYQLRTEARSGVEPYLNVPPITVGDTEGLKPIETTIEVPRGVIITGRLIDRATGRPVRARHVKYIKLPTNPNDGYPGTGHGGAVATTFKMTVPPGAGLLYATVREDEPPYTRARLRKEDRGKGIGGPGDGEAMTITLDGYHAHKFIDIPAEARDFTADLELTRGLSRKGRVVDPDGQPVAGARCYGLVSTGSFIKTLPDATFEVHGLEPGHPRQVIFAHKERRLVGAITLRDEDFKSEARLEVRLGPPCSVNGRLMDEDGLPLAGATLSVASYDGPGDYDNLPFGNGALWPEDETFTAGPDGRFEVTGLKPGVRCFISVHIKARPNTRINAGQVFRNIVPERFGEVRDVGEVNVKVAAE
jgi:protocatechuate 3,4-dioxygenase beta subunit